MLSSCPLVPTDCADKLPQTHFILMHAITDMDVHGEELRERPVGGRRTLREKRPQQTHVHVCSWFCDLGPMCPLGSLLTMVGAAGTLSSWGLVEGIQPLGGGTGVASSSPLPLLPSCGPLLWTAQAPAHWVTQGTWPWPAWPQGRGSPVLPRR